MRRSKGKKGRKCRHRLDGEVKEERRGRKGVEEAERREEKTLTIDSPD